MIFAEALNTAIEKLADAVTMEQDKNIKKAKDLGAFGVLVAAITSVVIGIFVFRPYVLALFGW